MTRDDLTLELALVRWSVVHKKWDEFSSGNMPYLHAFLAGWCCRVIGTSEPEHVGQFRESFRAGWSEAEAQIQIAERLND